MSNVLRVVVLLAISAEFACAADSSFVPQQDAGPEREPYWHLFLDNHIIARSTGFQRVIHHPQPRGVVLEGDKPWEQRGVTPLYVGWRKDGRLECYSTTHK